MSVALRKDGPPVYAPPLCDLPSSEIARLGRVSLAFPKFPSQAFSWVRVSWFASLQGLSDINFLCPRVDKVMRVIRDINPDAQMVTPSLSTTPTDNQYGHGADSSDHSDEQTARSWLSTMGGGSASSAG